MYVGEIERLGNINLPVSIKTTLVAKLHEHLN